MAHKSVLLKESIELLYIKKNGNYADLTVGNAGHFRAILAKLEEGNIIGFDFDERSIKNLKEELKLSQDKDNKKVFHKKAGKVDIYLINDNFSKLNEYLALLKINQLDGVLADLGWSSDQLGEIEGLSFENDDDALDMRFDKSLGVKASDLLNVLGRKQLEKMFGEYADIFGSKNKDLVNGIITYRKTNLFQTVHELKDLIDRTFRFQNDRFRKSEQINMYARVFQSLRIAVNDEINNLKIMIESAYSCLKNGGTLAIITFHSGEEKAIVSFLKNNRERVSILSKKYEENYIQPSVDELKENIRARSAKLFVFKKNI